MDDIRWILFLLVALVGAPGAAHALGLGEARVDSYLNQPLDVRIRLLDASERELDSLSASIATPADFARLGISSDALALDLEAVIDRSQAPPVLRVTSRRAATDPVLQLLIDARWASGRLLREYTLFLDPATVDLAPPAPARPARTEPEAPPRPRAADSQPQPRAETPRTAAPSARAAGGGRYGPVASGDTLWSIARQNLPADDVTMNQMMLAIVELNPGAFRDGNVHRLLRGAELELPDAEQVRAIDRDDAAAIIAAQNRAFRQGAPAEVPVVADAARGADEEDPDEERRQAPDDAAPPRDSETRTAGADHRLELVPPTDEEGGAGLDSDQAEVQRLRQQLARVEEELFTARLEAEEMQERAAELERMVRAEPGGFGLQDAELAGLEQTLRDARRASEEGADPALRADVSDRLDRYLSRIEAIEDSADSTEGEPAPRDQVADASGEEPDADAGAAQAAAEPDEPGEPASADEATTEPAASEPVVTEVGGGSGNWLTRPVALVAAAVVVLLLVLAGLWLALTRRRGAAAGEGEQPAVRGDRVVPAAPGRREPREAPDTPEARARRRIDEAPDDLGAHLALLEALAEDGRENDFEQALERMFSHVDDEDAPEWRAAVELASRVVPGHALAKGSSDWVADETPRSAPESEVEEDAEVDALMSRLDADARSEEDLEDTDDDWPDVEDEESEAPLLREKDRPDESRADRVRAEDEEVDGPGVMLGETGGESAGEESDAEDEGLQDLARELAEEPGEESADEDPSQEPTRRIESDAGEAAGEAEEADEDSAEDEQETEDEDVDPFTMDWGEESGEDDERADADASQAEDETPSDEEEAEEAAGAEEDDIFAPGDDDVEVKLDLAKAYLSWNSTDSAKTLLEEIVEEGNEQQRAEAKKLLDDL
ncbi:MAG: FimV/HubP family polar landmark protein [Wenzhouxiangellaceae bacterium]|nr:FimV/HubP family polar landmark protein [Wenzhouxiangellaceae bacterium]